MNAMRGELKPPLKRTNYTRPRQTRELGVWMREHSKLRELVLVPHGAAREDRSVITFEELPISSMGKAQMIAVADKLREERFNPKVVWVADDQRCRESAQVIRPYFPEAHFPLSSDLNQRRLPASVEGKTYEQLRVQTPDLYNHVRWPNDSPTVSYEGSESYQEFWNRIIETAFKKIAQSEETVGIITHGSNITTIARFILGAFNEKISDSSVPKHGEITHLLFEGGNVVFKMFFEHSHLGRIE